MNSVFITGIPTSGKTYLAKRLSKTTGLQYVGADSFRREMKKDPKLEKWVNHYWNLDEEKYYTETPCAEQWINLVNQSEAFWPTILSKTKDYLKYGPIIIEGVNLLPHLTARNFDFKGVVLLGESEAGVLEKLNKEPRWGRTLKLKRLEAEAFFNCEGKHYKEEAEKYGYSPFKDFEEAEKELLKMISGS